MLVIVFWRLWVVQSCRHFWEASVLPCFETNVDEWANAVKCWQFWEWRAPGPRGAQWDSAPHQFRLHRRCRSCWLSSKTQSSRAMEGPGKFPCTVTSVTSCRGHRVSAGCYPFQPILWWINQASSTAILQRGDHKQFSKNSADITRNFI